MFVKKLQSGLGLLHSDKFLGTFAVGWLAQGRSMDGGRMILVKSRRWGDVQSVLGLAVGWGRHAGQTGSQNRLRCRVWA